MVLEPCPSPTTSLLLIGLQLSARDPIVVFDGPSSIQPDVLYVPQWSNQIGLDSFILMDGLLFLFQFAIGKEHDIKPGLADFLATCPDLPPMIPLNVPYLAEISL
jgi:hypothetical protein